jgi:hypothetical protein
MTGPTSSGCTISIKNIKGEWCNFCMTWPNLESNLIVVEKEEQKLLMCMDISPVRYVVWDQQCMYFSFLFIIYYPNSQICRVKAKLELSITKKPTTLDLHMDSYGYFFINTTPVSSKARMLPILIFHFI